MEEYNQQLRHAKIMGWHPNRAGQSLGFTKGNTTIWVIRDGWQVADLVEIEGIGYYQNYRPEKTLAEAIDNNS